MERVDIENKLDEDFLFYLGFTNTFFDQFENPDEVEHCRAWLQKLCGMLCTSIDQKRNRNIYLSNLVLCMQEGKLSGPFLNYPQEVDISDAMTVFEHLQTNLCDYQEVVESSDVAEPEDIRDGRTYLATRTLPGGEGAFAYLAVTLADEEPKWLGGGEGIFDKVMEEKFQEMVPPMSEMERILLRRKDPVEREKVLTFYDALMQNIISELDEAVAPEENDTINILIEQLQQDLQRKGQWNRYEQMNDKQRRIELLLQLHERVYARRQKTATREEILDELEHQTMPLSFFDVSVQPEDKIELPAAMWEQAINKVPKRQLMEKLFNQYPNVVIEKFLDLLSNEKEDIAIRMQRRHEAIVSQMRKELRKEGEKGRLKSEEAVKYAKQVAPVLAAIKEAYERQQKALKKLHVEKESKKTTQQKLYEQLQEALYDTQKNVEEEAERGRRIREEINFVNDQTEKYHQVNDDSIRKVEGENIALMKNIKKLRAAVHQYETRIDQIKQLSNPYETSDLDKDLTYLSERSKSPTHAFSADEENILNILQPVDLQLFTQIEND
ncbi:hypothetical protein RN001_001117 [Aquatica leii]|uniref:DUF4485 domain-containing protein n=1 Tax=Aquatica leii TaxID=1421715 RepID=A0AAN7PKW3_9COLE|nr:hypothetical protein RN001_001117 [Aquatica leii]